MKFAFIASCTLIGAAVATSVHAGPAGTLIFTQPGTLILDAQGAARPAIRGSVLQDGERLVTPPGAISQIKLPDGSLIGMRPDSELKLTPPAVADASAPQGVSLIRGAARVIGVELMDDKKVSNFRFQSGPAVLQLRGADLESAVILPTSGTGQPPLGDNGPGSYQRLLVGSASVGNGPLAEPLVPRQVSFVGGPNNALVAMPSVSPNMFAANRATNALPMGTALQLKGGDALTAVKVGPLAAQSPIGIPSATPMVQPAQAILSPIFVAPPTVTIVQPIYTPPPATVISQPTTFVPLPKIAPVFTCKVTAGTGCAG